MKPRLTNNLSLNNTENIFTELGGNFSRPFAEFKEKLSKVKAYLFDWDGVFNDGVKTATGGSPFSEVDAMGTNMLRFGHWLKNGELPCVGIITGENNPSALYLSQRERFHALYFKSANKLVAFGHFLESNQLQPHEVAYFFDDVLDLGVAEKCGVRILVKHSAAPMFQNYAIKNEIADYITANDVHAVREICELILATLGTYDQTIDYRSHFHENYKTYLDIRQSVETKTYLTKGDLIEQVQG
jgi:3-deoxy-D-manno-octulosonate 8-phosphate phosphatase (KDO 8-P phosphatase)